MLSEEKEQKLINANVITKLNTIALSLVGISDILCCKNDKEWKELPNNVMKIVHTFQKYNIGKIFTSSLMTCPRTSANIAKINEGIKNMCISNNFESIEHNQTTAKDLWEDGVHLKESGKIFLGRNLLDSINNFLFNSLPRNPEFVNLV